MAVHGAQSFQQGRVGRQLRCGPVADFVDLEGQQAAATGRSGFCLRIPVVHGIFHGAMQGDLQPQKLVGTGGAEINRGLCAFRDGIHAGAALNRAQVERGARLFRESRLGQHS